MKFVFNKLVGLLSMVGTVAGLVLGGTTLKSNTLLAAAFFLLAIFCFVMFVGFLYNFIRYAQYEMPYENVQDEIEKEEP
jgi:hypothetical protein